MKPIYILAVAAVWLAFPAAAQQQRMRDFSLSPEETMREPDITHSPEGNYDEYLQFPERQEPITSLEHDMEDDTHDHDSDQLPGPFSSDFMTGFCDPGFRPMLQDSATGMQACIEEEKKKACGMYQTLPTDAQRLLNGAIGCVYMANGGDDPDAEPADGDLSCVEYDTRRLRLLRKYWKQPDVAEALVFLPDRVLYTGQHCMGGRH